MGCKCGKYKYESTYIWFGFYLSQSRISKKPILERSPGKVLISVPAHYAEDTQHGGMKGSWWLVDSCCGKTMTANRSDGVYWTAWTGGQVQVGNGNFLNVTHRGVVIVYARCMRTGKTVGLPKFKECWLVPELAFKILAVSDLDDNGIGCRFGEVGVKKHYLKNHSTGMQFAVRRFNRIHVLQSVDVAQVHSSIKVDCKELISPRKHWDIDLWFAVGRKRPASSNIVVKGEGIARLVHNKAPIPLLATLLHMDLGANPFQEHEEEEYYFKDACKDLIDTVTQQRCVPMIVYNSPTVSAEEVLCQLSRTVEEEPIAPAKVPANWDWCTSRNCENSRCQDFVCGVNRSSVSKTSPYSKAKSDGLLQHKRHGCTSFRTLYRGCMKGWIAGISIDKDIVCHCPICSLCKAKRASFKTKIVKSAEQVEYEKAKNPCVVDYCGPLRVKSKEGAVGFYLVTHKYKKWCQFFPVKTKAAAPAVVKLGILFLRKKFQIWVHHVHTDNAKEHKSAAWREQEDLLNFSTTYSPDYTPLKNNLAEHMNYILCTKALCMMVLSEAPGWTWALAGMYSTSIYNRDPPASGTEPSPFQACTGYPPDHSMYRVFWCDCYPLFFKEQGRGKFEVKSRGSLAYPCKFAGLGPTQPDSWLVYDPIRDVCFESAHCAFDESKYDGTKTLGNDEITDGEFDILMTKLASGLGFHLEDVGIVGYEYQASEGKTSGNGKAKAKSAKAKIPSEIQQVQQQQVDPNEDEYDQYEDQYVDSQIDANQYAPVFGLDNSNVSKFSPRITRSMRQSSEIDPSQQPLQQQQVAQQLQQQQVEIEAEVEPQANSNTSSIPIQFGTDDSIRRVILNADEIIASRPMINNGGPTPILDSLGVPKGASEQLEAQAEALATMLKSVSKIQDTVSLGKSTEFVEELICLAAAQKMKEKFPSHLSDPTSYEQAMARSDWRKWKEAIEKEMKGMDEMEVWEVIVDESTVPAGTNITKSKGVWKVKRLKDGSVDKHKYRLVACGYSQIYGLDYTETYSGVVDAVVIRIFLAIVAALCLKTKLVDVSQAFLYGELGDEEIYMRLPKYLGSLLVRLRKALYGLKQAGRTFNRKMSKFLVSLGYQQSVIEPCLFYLFTKVSDAEPHWDGFGVSYILCHVDDMPIASNSDELMDWTIQQIQLEFVIKVTMLDWFISLSIQVSKLKVSFHQEHYALQLLDKFNGWLLKYCANSKGEIIMKDTPGIPGGVLHKGQLPQNELEEAQVAGFPYAQLTGALLYLCNSSRFDLIVAVGNCAKFMSKFGWEHILAALHILQYLAKYPKLPVTYRWMPNGNGLVLTYEVDASYADDPDTARSRWGGTGFLSQAAVDVKSGILKSAMPSTSAAEQSALAKVVLRVLAARNYMEDFGFPQYDPTRIGEDNMAALLNSKNPVKSKNAKHLHVYHHITRENQMEFKTIDVYRRPTEQMRADVFTKLLGKDLHWQHIRDVHNLHPDGQSPLYGGVHFITEHFAEHYQSEFADSIFS